MTTSEQNSQIEALAETLYSNRAATYDDKLSADIALDKARRDNAPDEEIENLADIATATYWAYTSAIEAKIHGTA